MIAFVVPSNTGKAPVVSWLHMWRHPTLVKHQLFYVCICSAVQYIEFYLSTRFFIFTFVAPSNTLNAIKTPVISFLHLWRSPMLSQHYPMLNPHPLSHIHYVAPSNTSTVLVISSVYLWRSPMLLVLVSSSLYIFFLQYQSFYDHIHITVPSFDRLICS